MLVTNFKLIILVGFVFLVFSRCGYCDNYGVLFCIFTFGYYLSRSCILYY